MDTIGIIFMVVGLITGANWSFVVSLCLSGLCLLGVIIGISIKGAEKGDGFAMLIDAVVIVVSLVNIIR